MTASNDTASPAVTASFDRDFVTAPLVSVIVTCFNYQRYIGDCLRSIMHQTYPRIECLVVDDCSTDDSVQAIRDFIAANEGAAGFRLLSNEVNGGQMRSFLTGFQNSSGTFVVFVDADDTLFPDFVETHVKAHLNRDFIAGISCSDEILIDATNAVVGGAMEIGLKQPGALRRAGRQAHVMAASIEGWRETWRFGAGTGLTQPDAGLLYVSPRASGLNDWIWTTTSAVMFRRGVLALALTEAVANIRICADFFLLHFCHLMGGTLLIPSAHGCYRRHGANYFASNAVVASAVSPGGSSGRMTNAQMRGRVRYELTRQFPDYAAIIGAPHALWIIAATGSIRDCLALRHVAAQTFRFGQLKFFALVVFLRTRSLLHTIRRTLRLI